MPYVFTLSIDYGKVNAPSVFIPSLDEGEVNVPYAFTLSLHYGAVKVLDIGEVGLVWFGFLGFMIYEPL